MFNRFFSRFQAKAAEMQTVIRGLGGPAWAVRDQKGFIDEGYMLNSVVFSCINHLSDSVAQIPIEVKVNGEKDPTHPAQRLIDRPNPMQPRAKLVEEFLTYYLLTGNAYVSILAHNENQLGSEADQLWVWESQYMSISASDKERIPYGYIYQNNLDKRVWDVDAIDGTSDMLHMKTVHPDDRWYGMSPLQAAARDVDQNNSGGEWNQRMLKNSAEPSLILSHPTKLTEPQYRQLKKDIAENHQGPNRARSPLLLQGGATASTLSLTPRDMDWLAGINMTSGRIASVYKVPGQVIGLEGSQTFANYQQAREALYDDAAIPLAEEFVGELNNWLAPKYGEDVQFCLNLDKVPALDGKREKKFNAVNNATFMTTNEKRIAAGLDPKGDMEDETDPYNQVLVSAGLLPLDFDFTQDEVQDEKTLKNILMDFGLKKAEAEKKANELIQ